MNNKITVKLPDGTILIAELNNDPAYPGIQIAKQKTGEEETNEILCFVEFNSEKSNGEELCICAYTHEDDEPVYYASYHASAASTQETL